MGQLLGCLAAGFLFTRLFDWLIFRRFISDTIIRFAAGGVFTAIFCIVAYGFGSAVNDIWSMPSIFTSIGYMAGCAVASYYNMQKVEEAAIEEDA